MTELLTARFTDEQGTERTLTRDEILGLHRPPLGCR